MKYLEQRNEIIEKCLEMNKVGINQGTSGNISSRVGPDTFLITPSGLEYHLTKLEDIVLLDFSGNNIEDDTKSQYKPSSEWRIHADIYIKFPSICSIVHTHSCNATALACTQVHSIPPFHYLIGVVGGNKIPIAPYATFGTKKLSENVLETLSSQNISDSAFKGCLIRNHGVVGLGNNLKAAFEVCHVIELLATQYLKIKASGLEPAALSDEEMLVILEKFKTYGKKQKA
eukprot:snap_masked-scaffold_3-processed-gene-6.43-mRNA-1 protein AED:0.21 eAED:0.22 QI:0/-1/0/1/-1/1/1/0/229